MVVGASAPVSATTICASGDTACVCFSDSTGSWDCAADCVLGVGLDRNGIIGIDCDEGGGAGGCSFSGTVCGCTELQSTCSDSFGNDHCLAAFGPTYSTRVGIACT